MTVIFDPNTNLPHTIRSYEDHYIFGPSTNDLSVYNYTKANGVMFPRRFKTYYNGNAATQLLADFLVDAVTVNPKLPSGYFDGLPTSATETVMEKPVMVPDYGFAQVGEWSTNNLWSGTYGGKLSNLSATHPIPDVPQFWHLTFLDDQSFTQIVMEFDDAVIVGESPVHQSHLVIQWINEVLKRNITHIWVSVNLLSVVCTLLKYAQPTHHHHDHSYGTKDYINAGAKLICFDGAVDYWSKIPGIEFETFSETTPFIKRDANLELRIVKMFDIDHAEDMSYGFISRPCPKENDTVAIYEADFWNPGLTDYRFNQYDGGILLDQAAADGVSREAM